MKVKHLSAFNADTTAVPTELVVDQVVVLELTVPAAIPPAKASAIQYLITELEGESGAKIPLTASNIVFINVVDLAKTIYSVGTYGESSSFIKIDGPTKTTGLIPFNGPVSINSTVSPTVSDILGGELPTKVTVLNSTNSAQKITILIGVKL